MQNRFKHSDWLRILVVVVLTIGIFFRFFHLDRKIYWHDETYTSLRISGYTEAEFVAQAYNGQVISIQELHQKYQYPNAEKGLDGTLHSLATEDPQHPPFYFVMLRFWTQWFGSSITTIRSLSALISLLLFPGFYWLCMELFGAPLVGWIAILLTAVSPFHVLFAQEAREYVLWMVTILFSSAALLQALKRKTVSSWGLYGLTVALGFYAFLLSGLVYISHGLYVFIIERFRFTQSLGAYLLASIAGCLAFAPWLLTVIVNLQQFDTQTAWTAQALPLPVLANQWVNNISTVFLDLDLRFELLNLLSRYLIFGLVIYSLYFLCRTAPKQIWLFILLLVGVTAVMLILPDLILGGRRSGVTRYLIPCYLGIQLAVAHLLATQITAIRNWQQKLWQIGAIALISGGILSIAVSSKAVSWWNKGPTNRYPEIAQVVNSSSKPLVISSSDIGIVMSLSYLLDPKVQFQLIKEPNLPQIPNGFTDTFLFNPSETLRAGLEQQNYKMELVYKRGKHLLWKLAK